MENPQSHKHASTDAHTHTQPRGGKENDSSSSTTTTQALRSPDPTATNMQFHGPTQRTTQPQLQTDIPSSHARTHARTPVVHARVELDDDGPAQNRLKELRHLLVLCFLNKDEDGKRRLVMGIVMGIGVDADGRMPVFPLPGEAAHAYIDAEAAPPQTHTLDHGPCHATNPSPPSPQPSRDRSTRTHAIQTTAARSNSDRSLAPRYSPVRASPPARVRRRARRWPPLLVAAPRMTLLLALLELLLAVGVSVVVGGWIEWARPRLLAR